MGGFSAIKSKLQFYRYTSISSKTLTSNTREPKSVLVHLSPTNRGRFLEDIHSGWGYGVQLQDQPNKWQHHQKRSQPWEQKIENSLNLEYHWILYLILEGLLKLHRIYSSKCQSLPGSQLSYYHKLPISHWMCKYRQTQRAINQQEQPTEESLPQGSQLVVEQPL